jgi:hypothetical protein
MIPVYICSEFLILSANSAQLALFPYYAMRNELAFNPLYAWIFVILGLIGSCWVIESVSTMVRNYAGCEKEDLRVEEVGFIIALGSVSMFLIAIDLIKLDVDGESINMQFGHYFLRIMAINTCSYYIYESVVSYLAEERVESSDTERTPLLLLV